MIRPLSDDEKRKVLLQMVAATVKEAQRREPQLKQLRDTAQTVFAALVTAPTLKIEQAPMPAGMTQAPVEEIWSVTPKVTVE
jgi:hypothetical protein